MKETFSQASDNTCVCSALKLIPSTSSPEVLSKSSQAWRGDLLFLSHFWWPHRVAKSRMHLLGFSMSRGISDAHLLQ